MAIIDDIRAAYRRGSMLMRIIYLNIGVWVVLRVFALLAFLFSVPALEITRWVELPADVYALLYRPWTLLTYMVAHYDVLHILFNMLWLYWLGSIFLNYFLPKQLTGLYILGGLGGALLYILAFLTLPAFDGITGTLLGASASIIAIVVATAVWAPDYKINLLFIGEVSLKWVAIVTIGVDLLSINQMNTGGHVAHLGGAVVGVIFALAMRRGVDITRPVNAVVDSVVTLWPWRDRSGSASGKNAQPPTQAEIDAILDKVRRSGYQSLSPKERETLFRASGRK